MGSNWQKFNPFNDSSTSSGSRRMHVVKTKDFVTKISSVEDLSAQGFMIGNELGEGSYCKVKAATYRGKSIAVKIITRSHLSVDFESRFLPREIEILGKVNHKNIIHVYKIFSYPKRVYIFMELVKRGDLLGYIRNCGRLTEAEACHFFQQMVSAIQYLHNMNIAHRDLKCENLMITENDQIKVIDFGFCRSTLGKNGRRELSRTFCGSTAYAAPEVLQGIPYNPMMYDVWSLGCVLFIMVTGTMPFDDSNVRKMVTCQLKRQIRYPSTFQVSKHAKKLIAKMLEPDVTRRANIKQIGRSEWIKQNKDQFLAKDANELFHPNMPPSLKKLRSSNSVSTGTQTLPQNDSSGFMERIIATESSWKRPIN